MSTTLIRGGTLITDKQSMRADLLVDGETIASVGPNLKAATGEVLDVSGLLW